MNGFSEVLPEVFRGVIAFFTDWKPLVMMLIGGILILLAIWKEYEPALLLPIGFGAILVNIPFTNAIGDNQFLTVLYNAGIANELFPILIFIAIGAMIDFKPLLKNPSMLFFELLPSLAFLLL